MGVSYSVHIGPFVRCKKTISRMADHYRCANPECRNHESVTRYKGMNFCETCGNEIEMFQKTVKVRGADLLKGDDLYARSEDWNGEEAIFFPNIEYRSDRGKWRTINLREDTVCSEVPTGACERELAEFNDRFADSLAILRQAYGDENVEVLWGVVTDAN